MNTPTLHHSAASFVPSATRGYALLPILVGTTLLALLLIPRPTQAQLFREVDAGLIDLGYSSSAMGDLNNDGHLDLMLTGVDSNGRETPTLYFGDGTGEFRETKARVVGVASGATTLGDVNNDGNLDLVLTGQVPAYANPGISVLYLGDGTGGFDRVDAEPTDVAGRTSALGDVTNNGNLDLVITGLTPNDLTPKTALYLGDGTGGFSETDPGFTGVRYGSSSMGHVNGDGNLDLVITGQDSTGQRTTTLYLGDGDGGFRTVNAGLTGVHRGSSSLGDVNNDGTLDLVVTGSHAYRKTARLYLGDGTGGFDEANADLTGVMNGSSSLGDVNGDSHLDLVLTGQDANDTPTTTLYLGDGTGGFTKANAGLTGVHHSSSSLGDVDGDGDLDLVITGQDGSGPPTTMLYENLSDEKEPNP